MEAYRHVGRDDVSVVPEIIDRGNDRVDLVYHHHRGQEDARCGRSISSAITAFGNRQLTAVIKTSATTMLSFLTGGDVYDPDRVDADREQFRLYYRSQGYADASVTSAQRRIRSGDPRIYADLCDRRRPALPFRRHQRRLQRAGARSREAAPSAGGAIGRDVRRQRAGQDHRSARHRDGKARLSLCAGHAPHHARRRGTAHRCRVRDRPGPARPMSSASRSTATPAPATT